MSGVLYMLLSGYDLGLYCKNLLQDLFCIRYNILGNALFIFEVKNKYIRFAGQFLFKDIWRYLIYLKHGVQKRDLLFKV